MKVRTIASVLVVAVAAASVPIYASAQGKPPAGAKKPGKKKGDKGAPSATSAEAPPPPPPEPPPPPPEPATPASTASAAPPAPTASASATQEAAAAPAPKNDDWKRTAGIISIGSGVVLLGGAFLFYKLNTNQNNSDGYHAYARNVPPDEDVCDAAKADKKSPYLGADSPAQIRKICSRGKTYVTLEFVSLGLGAAAIGLGAYWLITSGKKDKAPASAWMLSPRLDAPGVDFAGRFLAWIPGGPSCARDRAAVCSDRHGTHALPLLALVLVLAGPLGARLQGAAVHVGAGQSACRRADGGRLQGDEPDGVRAGAGRRWKGPDRVGRDLRVPGRHAPGSPATPRRSLAARSDAPAGRDRERGHAARPEPGGAAAGVDRQGDAGRLGASFHRQGADRVRAVARRDPDDRGHHREFRAGRPVTGRSLPRAAALQRAPVRRAARGVSDLAGRRRGGAGHGGLRGGEPRPVGAQGRRVVSRRAAATIHGNVRK